MIQSGICEKNNDEQYDRHSSYEPGEKDNFEPYDTNLTAGKETMRICAKIDLDAVRYNMESMHRNLHKGTMMAAVVKADAYGHGAAEISGAIEDLPYLWGYAVATAEEAFDLINAGRRKPILILGLTFPQEYESLIEAGVRITISTIDEAREISQVATRLGETAYIHIALDTGMSRIGFNACDDTASTIVAISKLYNINMEGIFTHFARADEFDKSPAYKQLDLFRDMLEKVEAMGVHIPIRHCSNSAGIIEIAEANIDMVRAGITLYGLWPSDEVQRDIISIHPVMSLESHITYIKDLPAGCPISYGGTFVTTKTTRIATIPVGYADGYARSLSNKGYVLIHGRRAPICGRVCMDQFMVDVTDIPEARIGDLVTLLGQNGDDRITMEDLGDLSGRFNYEFACLITPRVPRVFVHSDTNELLN